VDITFDAPHALQSGSPPTAESQPVLRKCLQELRRPCPRAKVSRSAPEQVTWHLPSVFNAGSVPVDNAEAIQALLECLTDLNTQYLQYSYENGIYVPPLYQSGVVYDRTEVWDSVPALYALAYGDCKSLACALAAQYRFSGRDCKVVFRYMPHKSGPLHVTYHILCLTEDGWEDPSKACGMRDDENSYFRVQ